ncbi:MAG TPA: TetR/AcrR family transcriptional regulator [Symbiobacteriaceae bacterium]|jgi:AcrR family transcriptional regulator
MARPGRKEHVLDAAVTLFGRKGYHGTTVRDIARESGMLSGSLYAHIDGKEDLLFEIVARAADRFMVAVQPIAGGFGPASDKLRRAMAAHIRVVAGSRDAATVFLHEWTALSPQRRALIAEKRDAYEALFARIIREGVDCGEFRPLDERFARLTVLSALNWLYAWYTPGGPLGSDEVADKFAELFLEGFRQEGACRS